MLPTTTLQARTGQNPMTCICHVNATQTKIKGILKFGKALMPTDFSDWRTISSKILSMYCDHINPTLFLYMPESFVFISKNSNNYNNRF